jgi:branched-chain amino acid aminotransferase
MRARHGKVFRLERHLARLRAGLSRVGIPPPPELEQWVVTAARSLDVDDASVRLTVTRGLSAGGLLPAPGASPTAVVIVSPRPALPDAIYSEGLKAIVASGRFNNRSMTAGLKTLAYADSIAALCEARAAGADEAIFLDTDGHCVMATASNLFVCARGELITPPLSCGILPGITRATVLELAAARGLRASETAFDPDELQSVDEVFLTSSLRGLAPVVQVGPRRIGDGRPGRQTRLLMEAYTDLVAGEVALR